MPVVKNLIVRGSADFSSMKKEATKAQEHMTSFKDNLSETLKKLEELFLEVFAVEKIVEFGKASVEAATEAAVNETKLATVMKQRMNATDDVIDSVEQLILAQQKLGVISADSQTAGAQELAVNLQKADSIKALIPVMNNLVAQQYGLNATSENTTAIAKVLGKATEGNITALQRYGVVFSAAQKKTLQLGTEQQRVALIAEAVQSKVGDMNAELAKTPEGQMQQLQNSMTSLKESIGNGILSALQAVMPLLNMMVSGLQRAAVAFSSFMGNLFGKSQAQTSATDSQTDSVNALGDAYTAAGAAAKGSVAGFDEVNTLSDNTGDAGAVAMPDTSAVSGVGDVADGVSTKVKEMLKNVDDALKGLGDYFVGIKKDFDAWYTDVKPSLQTISDSLKTIHIPAWEGFKAIMTDIGALAKGDLHNGLAITKGDVNVLADLLNGNFKKAATDAWSAMKDINWPDMVAAIESMTNPVMGVTKILADHATKWSWLNDALETAKDKIKSITWKDILDGVNLVADPLGEFTSKIVDSVDKTNLFGKAMDLLHTDVLTPIGSFLSTELSPAIDGISTKWGELSTNTTTKWGEIKTAISTAWNNIQTGIAWDDLKTLISSKWDDVSATAGTKWIEIKKVVSDGWGAISKLDLSSVETAVNAIWTSLKKDASSAWNDITSTITGEINGVIDKINGFISRVDGIKINIPSVDIPLVGKVGGGSIGMPQIPTIPHLADGGITNGPMMALIGDNTGGKEVVSPLDDLTDKIQSAVAMGIMSQQSNGNQKQGDIVIKLDGTTLARVLAPYSAREATRLGSPMITTSGKSVITTS